MVIESLVGNQSYTNPGILKALTQSQLEEPVAVDAGLSQVRPFAFFN